MLCTPLHSHGADEGDIEPESQTMNEPRMQHVEFEWDFYPGRQRVVIAGETKSGLPGEKQGGWERGFGAPACLPPHPGAECLWEAVLAPDSSRSQAREEGHGCWYLCKSPSLASKKFTVYLTDLAIRIRMSNVSWERPQCDLASGTEASCEGESSAPLRLAKASRPFGYNQFAILRHAGGGRSGSPPWRASSAGSPNNDSHA